MVIVSFIAGAFIIYPRIIDLPWELPRFTSRGESFEHILFFIYRYLFFCVLTWILLSVNIRRHQTSVFTKRLLKTFLITAIAYIIYLFISKAISKHDDCFTGLLLFQFVVACLLCSFTGHIFALYSEQREHEREIEQLKTENLQSRCEALANQINPHFFFNSLNGLSALVRNGRKEQTLKYIHELSGVFRYILQSEKKGLVPLSEELSFLDSFRYLQEIRYADKLSFTIHVPGEKKSMLIPVLSLLPLIENIVKHNMIDSENRMDISICMNERDELVVSNPVHEKIDRADRNGIGLTNLSDRFDLLLNRKIRIEHKDGLFKVYLPLTA
jgi:sensor histidine kinase YesM